MTTPTTPKSTATKIATWLGIAAVAAVAAYGYMAMTANRSAPEVTYTDITGQKMTTSGLIGKVVMVNFWATSCATCVKEMPKMVETYQKYKGQGLEYIAVAMQYDRPDYVLNYTQTRQLPFKVALDTQGDLAKSFGDVALTPTTFVIGKDGKIIKRYVGEPSFAELHQLLDKALAT
ncbi:MAG: TlpA family protein disulfide reductase [Burkholderiales bacterium]|nr:TlpA family protein disulfide reductase [Burkholderiales bacterium]